MAKFTYMNRFALWSKTHGYIPFGVCSYGTRVEAESARMSPLLPTSTRSDIRIIRMIGTQIHIRVHEFYIHTSVRFYAKDAFSYVEYGVYGADTPKRLFECETQDELRNVIRGYTHVETNSNRPCLPEFRGFFEIVILIPEKLNVRDFEVEKARYVDAGRGGRDVTGAFRDPNFKGRILKNLFQQMCDKNTPKLIKILNALDVVGA